VSSPVDLSHEFDVAHELAREAAVLVRRFAQQPVAVKYKDGGEPVTEADLAGQCGFALGETVVEYGQLGPGLDDASADEVSEHTGAHHLQEVADFFGRKAWQGVENRRALGHGGENSIHKNGM
jgi:hypothetical protein